ncbi:MAG: TIGR02757 family protein [Bacteroidetes bacterium]|nr:TIGR02757 family protein [Bacteroidota bacterium]
MTRKELTDFLNQKHDQYNRPQFIADDPIIIPHQFSQDENREIAGFLTASLSWGQRAVIIKNALKMMQLMDNNPYEFLQSASEKILMKRSEGFVHRTFNGIDLHFFLSSLQNIYKHHGGLRHVFQEGYKATHSIDNALIHFRQVFFSIDYPSRTQKHVSDIMKGASAKRLNMFLRWMARHDNRGVDFGLWNEIPTKSLYLPLDVHTGNVARKLGLLKRKQNDWKAVAEVTETLRQIDPHDPVKYDFALFGLGMYENF